MGCKKRLFYRREDGAVAPGSPTKDGLILEIESHRDGAVRSGLLSAFLDLNELSSNYRDDLVPHLLDIARAIPADTPAKDTPSILRAFAQATEATEDEAVRKKRYRVLGAACLYLAECDEVAEDPHMAWIRDNREMVLVSIHRYRNIAQVMAGDASLFRMIPNGERWREPDSGGYWSLVEFDTGERWIQDLVLEAFSGSPRGATKARKVAASFAESLSGDVPSSPRGFTVKHLTKQIEFFADDEMAIRGVEELYIHLMRTYVGEVSLGPADGVTLSYLESSRFIKLWREGFRAVLLNPLDPVPEFDRWFLFPNGTEDAYAAGKPNRGHSVDFLRVDEPLRATAKRWFWSDDASLTYSKSKLQTVALFLDWRRREGPRFVSLGESYLISSEEIEVYLLGLRRRYTKDGMAGAKMALKSFFDFLAEEDVRLVDPLCLHVLDEFGAGEGGESSRPTLIPDEHFEALEKAFKEHSTDSLDGMLQYAAFMLLGYTPIRGCSIFDLKLSHIHESSRPGRHVVRQPGKTTGRDGWDLGIPPKIKKIIDQVVVGTSTCRDSAPEDLRDYVFLTSGMKGAVTVYSEDSFRKKLYRTCKALGLPTYNRRAIRSRYMTRISNAGMRLGMDPGRTREATGHVRTSTDERFYINRSDREYYEALYGIEIGTAKIAGELSLETPPDVGDSDLVSEGSGYCSSELCSLDGAVSCLLCRHFRTTPRHIPRMKEAVADVDRRIMDMETDHDRGHLAARKKLYVAYICALESLKREPEGE